MLNDRNGVEPCVREMPACCEALGIVNGKEPDVLGLSIGAK